MVDSNDDRRRYQRLERCDEVKIKQYSYPERGSYSTAKVVDISGGGLQLETKQHFPDGTQLKIEMNFVGWQKFTPSFLKYFGDASRRPLVVLAEVLRCTRVVAGRKYEVATKFIGIDENHRRALVRFIKSKISERN